MLQKGISVVTTTWNEKENLARLIFQIRKLLQGHPHEIIVIDDSSPDGTINVAKALADTAITKKREGQTIGLLEGMKLAKYPRIVTIDSDLENNPEHIVNLANKLDKLDIAVACRKDIPRISEKIASKTLGKIFGVKDSFSNYRAYRKDIITKFNLRGKETFGAEFLIIAKKSKMRIGEIFYLQPPRRKNPRIGGTIRANLRIMIALAKSLILYIL